MSLDSVKQKILIVDDMPTNIKVLGEALRSNFDISFARSGQKALEILDTTDDYDLILLDIMMPELDGYEVCKKLQSDSKTKSIPVIFITAKTDDEDQTRGFEAGAVDYITKPFNPTIVKARVKTHLELKRFRDNLAEQVKQRTKELMMAELSYKELFENIIDIIVFVDKDGKILTANPKFYNTIGISVGDEIGASLKTIVHPEDISPVEAQMLARMQKTDDIKNFQFRIINKNGLVLPVECNAKCVEKDGEHIGFQMVIRDISDRK